MVKEFTSKRGTFKVGEAVAAGTDYITIGRITDILPLDNAGNNKHYIRVRMSEDYTIYKGNIDKTLDKPELQTSSDYTYKLSDYFDKLTLFNTDKNLNLYEEMLQRYGFKEPTNATRLCGILTNALTKKYKTMAYQTPEKATEELLRLKRVLVDEHFLTKDEINEQIQF